MKNYLDLSDAEVLAMVDVFGPGIVGHYLFERAQWVKQHNPNGSMGPDQLDVQFVPSDLAMQDLTERGMVKELVIEKPVKRGPGRPRKEQ